MDQRCPQQDARVGARRPSVPRTRKSLVRTASGPVPILQVQEAWWPQAQSRMNCATETSPVTSEPGVSSNSSSPPPPAFIRLCTARRPQRRSQDPCPPRAFPPRSRESRSAAGRAECWDVIVFRQALGRQRGGRRPDFEDEDAHAAFREPARDRSSAGARADDNIVEGLDAGLGHRFQKVLMNSISARLSSSLSAGSGPKLCSSLLRLAVSLNSAVPK